MKKLTKEIIKTVAVTAGYGLAADLLGFGGGVLIHSAKTIPGKIAYGALTCAAVAAMYYGASMIGAKLGEDIGNAILEDDPVFGLEDDLEITEE